MPVKEPIGLLIVRGDLLNNQLLADKELVRDLGEDVEGDDGEDEAQGHDHDDNGVDSQPAGLVGVELQHSAARATGAGRASRGWSLISLRSLSFLVVSSSIIPLVYISSCSHTHYSPNGRLWSAWHRSSLI
ncbi:hypothetical protein TRICI_002038 [Trichomonascus ciferrii]|uniref:Uncharacterized protein n=1 Tax=Trichomonascus ciferrii TaxID=44093 RepID=A0A642V7M4_9ASCO|nr:hypothetical protein TRICI_002038 [Trichomonascus ciferrii]